MREKRVLLVLGGLLALPVVGLLVLYLLAGRAEILPSGLHDPARVAWKDRAIAEIAARAEDEKWLAAELARIQERREARPYDWFSKSLIPMENGDWIIYAAECYKSDPRIWDIFIGRGSDGKWYYTTYHFCVGMMELGQTKSLSEFAEYYAAREFDGKSDACLEMTWPTPAP